MNRIGVAIVGVNGAVASTRDRRRRADEARPRAAHRHGHRADGRADRRVDHRAPRLRAAREPGLRRAGTSSSRTSTRARCTTRCFPPHTLEQVQAELERVTPWPAVFAHDVRREARGQERRPRAATHREEIAILEREPRGLQARERPRPRRHGEPRVDRALPRGAAGPQETSRAFEAGLDASDPAITPAMRYFYAANKLQIPYCNFTPSLTNVPALDAAGRARWATRSRAWTARRGRRCSRRRSRRCSARAACSSRAGTRRTSSATTTARCSTRPSSNKTKVLSKAAVLDSIVGYHVENHQVHIHYYKPARRLERGLGQHRHRRASPASRCRSRSTSSARTRRSRRRSSSTSSACSTSRSARGERGIQRQLSMFFKSPYHAPGRDAGARPLQAGEAPPRLGARARDEQRQVRAHERREGARGAHASDARVGRGAGAVPSPLFGGTPVAHAGRAPRLADRHRRRARRGGARARPRHPLGPVRARGDGVRGGVRAVRRREALPAHALRDERAARGARRRRACARATRSSSRRTASSRRRWRCSRSARSRCSPTSTWRPGASIRPRPRRRSRRARARSCRCTCTAAPPT